MQKLLPLLALVLAVGHAEVSLDDASTVKDGSSWCPIPLTGTQCPPSSFFHYYKCCGTLNSDCCFNLQVWVIVVLVVIAVLMLASFVLGLLRCVFCRR